jgi:hypothetical protein
MLGHPTKPENGQSRFTTEGFQPANARYGFAARDLRRSAKKKMNTPPDQSVTAQLEGCVIDAIMVMRYQVDFVCEDQKFSFSISSPFCFGRDDQIQDMPWTTFPLGHTDIPKVLGSTIVSAKTDEH